jgi:hypothetical protein
MMIEKLIRDDLVFGDYRMPPVIQLTCFVASCPFLCRVIVYFQPYAYLYSLYNTSICSTSTALSISCPTCSRIFVSPELDNEG